MSSNFFQITSDTVLHLFSQNLAHMIYAPIRKKTAERIFDILILQFLGKFFKF